MPSLPQEPGQPGRPIVCGGLRYLWRPDRFLTEAEARYALAQLWRLCAGTTAWESAALIDVPALDADSLQRQFDLAPGALDWVRLDDLLPPGRSSGLDTDRLPALCRADATLPCIYRGLGAFPLDIVAAAFVMLSRWEEIRRAGPLDSHGRARAIDTLAYRQNFLYRPILDDWAMVLRRWLEFLDPGWLAKPSQFRVEVTHDLDHLQRFPTPWRIARSAGAELVLRSHSPLATLRTVVSGIDGFLHVQTDPYFKAIGRQLDISESLGLRGSFNVMTARKSAHDEGYELTRPPYRDLLKAILDRGHRVGWHPGYRAADESSLFDAEKTRMDGIMGTGGYGGRHHYLRWTAGKSWEQWENHGLAYDSSVGYADEVGYRCGTSHPFPCFSSTQQRQLTIVEEPLVIMDCALEIVARKHRKPPRTIALELLSRARTVGGAPAVLYHNTYRFASRDAAAAEDALLAVVREVLG